ncbi:MAG: hypothetical protein IPL46_15895 [Saprospiraceae bacterium]|nr:hypothetical protein [Saprospiraceae bacterium]
MEQLKSKVASKWIPIVLFLVLLVDISYSFYQHYQMPIGGDIAQIVLPSSSSGYHIVLKDPLGLRALLNGEYYSNPNRFFAHWTASQYFLKAPLLFQKFVSPIDSIYLSIALLKTSVQILILFLIVAFITNLLNPLHFDFLLAAALVTPMFQTSGFNRFMGIIDQSVIYTFFYAFPLALLLIFLFPFHRSIYHRTRVELKTFPIVVMMLFGIILTLGGPLNPGIILIFSILVLFSMVKIRFTESNKSMADLIRRINLSKRLIYILVWVSLLCLYSLYIGRFNDMNLLHPVSLLDRYLKVPRGIFELLTTKVGPALLLVMIGLNAFIIARHYRRDEGDRILTTLNWIGIFAIVYLLLLPLGGYRIYRPNVVRYDTFMPVMIAWIFAYGLSTAYLIRNIVRRHRFKYLTAVLVFLATFTYADRITNRKYLCERNALETIQRSRKDIVLLENNCPVMEFRIVTDYVDSDLNSDLLQHWKVTKQKKLFYQKNERE